MKRICFLLRSLQIRYFHAKCFHNLSFLYCKNMVPFVCRMIIVISFSLPRTHESKCDSHILLCYLFPFYNWFCSPFSLSLCLFVFFLTKKLHFFRSNIPRFFFILSVEKWRWNQVFATSWMMLINSNLLFIFVVLIILICRYQWHTHVPLDDNLINSKSLLINYNYLLCCDWQIN